MTKLMMTQAAGRRAGRPMLALLLAGISAPALAQEAALSRSAFAERFTQYVGHPPMQYLTNWRMQCGARLLREGHANVASVALDVGYESEAAFARAFKRATGLPPATWRKAQQPSLATV